MLFAGHIQLADRDTDLSPFFNGAQIIFVNASPIGTYPNILEAPNIPYKYLNSKHLLFDLIYNPKETEFLKRGKLYGSKTSNGLKMLKYQADKSWELWST